MGESRRLIAIVGRLGVFPPVRLSLPGRRLLANLALRTEPVARGVTSAELWPDVVNGAARANLRRALWQIPVGWVQTDGDDLVLEAECDLPRARRIAERALKGEPLALEDIVLLSSDILPGWHEEWVVPAQESFHLLRVQALEAACRTMSSSGQFALATQAGAAAVAAEPLRESAAEALIEAHLAQRNRYEAAQCFHSLARRLHDELGVPPDPSLTRRLAGIGLTRQRAHAR
jgi:DNA-binding SARP family transcriptional activator